VAELDREGLRHEEMPSGREWGEAARKWGRTAARELGRCTGLRLTLLEIAFYCAAHVGIVDCRALSVIARKRKITRRALCAGLAELEERGYVLRVFRAGVRLARDERGRVVEVQPDDERVLHNVQRGSETSALLPVGLVKFVPLMPPGRERKARAFLAESALKDPRVRAAIAAKGNTIPSGIPRSSPAPQAGSAGDVSTRPAGLARKQSSASIGTQSVTRSVSSVVLDRTQVTPTPAAPRDVESAGGADAPSPPIAPSAASTVPEAPSCVTPPPAAGERQNGPRLVSALPATLVSEPRPPTVPPATNRTGSAGSRSEARPTLPEHLRGLHVPERQVLDWLVEHNPGMSRGKAWDCIKGYRQSAWWRLQRDARGESSGRERAQGRRDAKAVADKAVAADLDGDRLWAKVHRNWSDTAGGAEFFGWIMALRHVGWARQEGALVVRVTGPTDVLNRIAFRKAWLEGSAEAVLGMPVVISWERS
jgi:DNA-binding MarR family transcriptional regulator